MLWEKLVKALAETQYAYQEFRSLHVGVRSRPTAREAAAIVRYRDRLDELREVAAEEGIEWSEASQPGFSGFRHRQPRLA